MTSPQSPAERPEPKPVAWVCTKRTSVDKHVFEEPFFASNPAYVQAHPDHDWTPLYVHPDRRSLSSAAMEVLRELIDSCDAVDASLNNFHGDDDEAAQERHRAAWSRARALIEGKEHQL